MGGCPFEDKGPDVADFDNCIDCDETVDKKLQEEYDDSMGSLKCVVFVSIFFIAAQLTGGILAHSIAIMCDTAHLASDMVGFLISISALKMGMNKSSKNLTFGWQRAEIIGAIVSVVFLVAITIWLTKEAIERFMNPTPIAGDIMLFTAVVGLIFNLIQMRILHGGGDHDHFHGHHDHDDEDEHDHDHHHHDHGEHNHDHGHSNEQSAEHNHDHGHSHDDHGHHGHHHHEGGRPEHTHDHSAHNHDHGHAHFHDDHHHEEKHDHSAHKHDHGHSHDHNHDHAHEEELSDVEETASEKAQAKLEKKERKAKGIRPERNVNVDAAYLHALSDMINSIGVIIAAIIIWFFPSMKVMDPICAFVFAILVIM